MWVCLQADNSSLGHSYQLTSVMQPLYCMNYLIRFKVWLFMYCIICVMAFLPYLSFG